MDGYSPQMLVIGLPIPILNMTLRKMPRPLAFLASAGVHRVSLDKCAGWSSVAQATKYHRIPQYGKHLPAVPNLMKKCG